MATTFPLKLWSVISLLELNHFTDKDGNQVFIHLDKNGLDSFISDLKRLKLKLEQNECDHIHLMSEDWGGYDLSATKLSNQEGEDNIVHHVKIYAWNDEWKKKHGLSD